MGALSTLGFAFPLALLLLPLPILARRLMPPSGERGGALVVPPGVAAAFGRGRLQLSGETGNQILAALLWCLLVVALAGPRTVVPAEAAPAQVRDIVLALDVSGSMERPDFEVNGEKRRRLDVMKGIAADFVRRRAGDRVGVVIFGERAYVASPLSFDVEAVAKVIEGLEVGLAGRATAIGEGLGLSLKRLSEEAAASKVVVLLSDGAQNAGTVQPLSAAGLAADLGVTVHTISLGPIELGEGARGDEGTDSRTLAAIAGAAGGQPFRARTTNDLETVLAAIDQLETSEGQAPPQIVYRSLWAYPGALALAAALVMMGAGRLGRRR